ncbi:Smr domain-containing protein [Kordia periserrulae]|uniref:Smr domain-containing protein n=1 Tax=Kordia periserrulae TaxID=701523 RepID=A0A2T6C2S5_9FLAO|nr:Smr/MutS family protein [Kordia periserrulae]PTX62632.1 Smr domain-containing protein [Kordia periserrulae]
MKFQVGDYVETIDDVIKGVVQSIDGNSITIETDEGFPLRFEASELVKISSDEIATELSNQKIYSALQEKEAAKKPKRALPKSKKERIEHVLEVDLHIHQLTNKSKGMSNYDMLTLQTDTAKRQLEFAIRNRIPKVVFIHGVGAGVLKEELYYLFRRYDNVKYYDANYQKYGLGATEVYIYQNPK